MLVLKRSEGQRIRIDGNIVVEVRFIGHDFAQLGVSAPADVAIHREEVAAGIARAGGDPTESRAGRRKEVAV